MAKNLDQAEWQRRVDLIIEQKPLKPGRGRLIVARDPREEFLSREADLVKPGQAQEESQTGTVVALGTPRENQMGSEVEFVYQLGSRVIINQIAGKRLRWYDLEMAVMPEDEIIVEMLSPAQEQEL